MRSEICGAASDASPDPGDACDMSGAGISRFFYLFVTASGMGDLDAPAAGLFELMDWK
jgi:hypothetical protein